MNRQELKNLLTVKMMEKLFTKNSTESLNLIAHCFGEKFINEGDEIISTELEHHKIMFLLLLEKEKRSH